MQNFKMKTKEFYREKTCCGNCRTYQGVDIPKGITILNFLKITECFKCGCKELRLAKIDESPIWKKQIDIMQ